MSANVIDVADPADPRLDDFRDLNSVDRRPDLPSGKGLVIAEGVLVVQRMLASRFRARALLGTDRRLGELEADLTGVEAPYYRVERGCDGRGGRIPSQPRGAGFGVASARADRDAGARRRPHRGRAGRRQRPREPRVDLPQRSGPRRRRDGVRRRLRRPAVPARRSGVDGPRPACAVRVGRGLAERLGAAARQRISAARDDARSAPPAPWPKR